MSSHEIAELTGKRHDHVLADVRTMLSALGKAAPEFSGAARIPGPNNSVRMVPVFNLPQDLTLTLVTGYNVVLRHRVVVRWQELEAQAKAPRRPQGATNSSAPISLCAAHKLQPEPDKARLYPTG